MLMNLLRNLKSKNKMEYKMKQIGYDYPTMGELKNMHNTIMSYLRGNKLGFSAMSERARQYFTWGARNFKYIVEKDNKLCYGIQFNVSGLLFKGRVRIYYNRASDYFDVELLKARKDELVWGSEDIDCFQLHNVLHQHIERIDDVEV